MAECNSVMSVWTLFVVALFLQAVSGNVRIVPPFPPNIYPIEGETAAVTCIANGTTDEVQFVRRNEFGKFSKLEDNTGRVYMTNTTTNTTPAITTFTLHFKTVAVADDSTIKRYECWAHKPGDATDQWDNSAKHGFNIQVIKKQSLPSVSPSARIDKEVKVGAFVKLECNLTLSTQSGALSDVRPEAVHWLKNDEIIETIYADGGKFTRTLKPLEYENISPSRGGNYTCILETKLKNIKPYNITGGPFIVRIIPKFSGKKEDNEIVTYQGESGRFDCSAEGFPLSVKWQIKLRSAENWDLIEESNRSNIRYSFSQAEDYLANKLTIDDIQYSDRGFYRCCIVRVNASENCQSFVLRVRDPLGALWPVIGIIIEAILLFLIIFFCEKKRKKNETVERTDGRAEFSYTATDDGDKGQVRLRQNADKPTET